jgi:hypothetical protein
MRVHYLLSVPVIFLAAAAAFAQTAAESRAGAEQTAPWQRRAELRQALKPAAPGREGKSREQTQQAVPVNRQLSEQERAELRRLLRQQGAQDRPERR